ncbi:MAG: hypothetical protein GF331_14870 [Chitinivibrionales bacterium]|nr:hypothetical protein [Chitinivibrionales bacterium]
MIEHYSFGRMTIDGVEYTSDVVILPDRRVVPSWRRREGHRLALDDLGTVLDARPSTLIVGTGRFGLMRPEKRLAHELEQRGVSIQTATTAKAATLYNERSDEPGTAACFHLTC